MVKTIKESAPLARAFEILEAFDEGDVTLTVSEMARRTGLPTSTAHRIVHQLVEIGALEEHTSHYYAIGRRIWEIASRGSHRLQETARPHMEDLAAQLNGHVQLSILDGQEVLYLDRAASLRSRVENLARPGFRLPAVACSPGVVMIAYLPESERELILDQPYVAFTDRTPVTREDLDAEFDRARRNGYTVADRWIHVNTVGVALPIFDTSGEIAAALSVVVSDTAARPESLVAPMRLAARSITQAARPHRRSSSDGLNRLRVRLRTARRVSKEHDVLASGQL